MERKVLPKRVSDSFRAHEMLSDGDLSEDYDNDPCYFSFDDAARQINIGKTTEGELEESK
jgi:hypothetical protein